MARRRGSGKGPRQGGKAKAPPKPRSVRLRTCRRCGEQRTTSVKGAHCEGCIPNLLERWSEHVSSPSTEKTLAKYNITVEDHATMFFDQNGLCAICHDPVRSRRAKGFGGLVVDHDHDSGRVRSLLCARCNTEIGLMGENHKWLKAAANYVSRAVDPGPYMDEARKLYSRVEQIEERYEEPRDAGKLRERAAYFEAKAARLRERPVARGH